MNDIEYAERQQEGHRHTVDALLDEYRRHDVLRRNAATKEVRTFHEGAMTGLDYAIDMLRDLIGRSREEIVRLQNLHKEDKAFSKNMNDFDEMVAKW